MNFAFSEEQETIRDLAREILEKEAGHDRVKEVSAGAEWLDRELWQKLAEANLLGIAVPEAQGGMGMGFLELCVLLEEVGRTLAPLPVIESLVLAGLALAEAGSEAQRETWLPRLAGGEALFSVAMDDAGSGPDEAPATTARAEGEDFALTGTKLSVGFAAAAERILVPASAPDGVGLFLVDPRAPGVSLESRTLSTGQPLSDVSLDGVRVAAADRLGGATADTAALVGWLRERLLVAIAALQTGVSDRALAITADYAKEREQFGAPIGSFQAVQHRCADGYIDLGALRWCTWRAAWRLAEGLPAARDAAVAKFWAAEAGSRIANASLHLHGGLGSDVDYPIQRYFLWSKALELSQGAATPQLVALGRDLATGATEEAR
jgi:alkylation response protein AidB-like acyl-CoA dehydrogenase